jgi:hypothetical protein
VLQELELRAAAAEERAQQLERERQERQRRWEQVRDEAEVKVREHHRARVLLDEVERWRQATQLGGYLTAMGERMLTLAGEELSAAEAWLRWAQAYRAELDPLSQPPTMPADPRFTADVLAPFMRGLSPYGAGLA